MLLFFTPKEHQVTKFEIILSGVSLAAAITTTLYVWLIIKLSGRDRPNDPDLVREFIHSAPSETLKHVCLNSNDALR